MSIPCDTELAANENEIPVDTLTSALLNLNTQPEVLPAKLATKEEPAINRFFDLLPRELRDMIYERYWWDTPVAYVGHPEHSAASTALLLVNYRMYREAKEMMLKAATFTINLDPEKIRDVGRDIAKDRDSGLIGFRIFCGRSDVLYRFQQFHFHLNMPPPYSSEKSYWPQAASSVANALLMPDHKRSMTFKIGLGCLSALDDPADPAVTRSFARVRTQSWKTDRETPEERQRHDEQDRVDGSQSGAQTRARLSPKVYEDWARMTAIVGLGFYALSTGTQLVLESQADGRRSEDVLDSMDDMFKAAKKLGGGEMWAVLNEPARHTVESELAKGALRA